ncbi:hypothetical protein ACF0H5_005107 [Mactra antiquata]
MGMAFCTTEMFGTSKEKSMCDENFTNRFDKRNISTAARTWVASQHVKLQDRPMYPLQDADQDGYNNAVVPYTGGNTGNQATRSDTPALVYNPNYAENQPYGDVTKSLIGQPDAQQATRTAMRNRSLRSDYPQDTARLRWGQPIKFDCKIISCDIDISWLCHIHMPVL